MNSIDVAWLLTLIAVSFCASLGLTWVVFKAARSLSWMDAPNARSAHTVPTPRGGGLGFVLVIGLTVGVSWLDHPDHRGLWIALAGGTSLVAIVGWLDDLLTLSARTRLFAHVLAAIWAVVWVQGGITPVDLGFATIDLGYAGYVVGALAIVWLINLYNFMDGLDGLAAGQATLVSGVAAVLLASSSDVGLAVFLAVACAAIAGFLPWNWPPARIFMGDVGSGSLGFMFGTVALYTSRPDTSALHLTTWALLLAWFLLDATATLLVRIARGEQWYEAHNSHTYQVAARALRSHRAVTVRVLAIGVVCVAGAALVTMVPATSLPVFLVCFGLVTGMWIRWRTIYGESISK